MNSIFHRVSIRKYKPREVEPEKIERLLRAAMAAPSACNQQPWEFYVVTSLELRKKLSHATPYTSFAEQAPVVLVPAYRGRGVVPQYFHIDMAAAVENILLEADELELGACWMGIAPEEDRMLEVKSILNMREDLTPFCLISVGYPDEARPQQERFEEERVHYIR